jgi:GntR family transcriptional repressor for pyruvate dehydrogenase complex
MRSGIRITRANEARRDDFIQQVRREHHAIVDAIEAGDPQAAEAAARTHMKHAAERLADADDRFWSEAAAALEAGDTGTSGDADTSGDDRTLRAPR